MSIAVGLVSDDGIVLASDTRYTTTGIVNYGEKIYPLPKNDYCRVVVAGAGDVGFLRSVAEKIENAMPRRDVSLVGIQAVAESANKSFFEDYILPHGFDPSQRPNYELIVAAWHQQEGSILLQTTDNATVPVRIYHLQGSGGVTAQPYAGVWWENMPAFEAELAAVFLVIRQDLRQVLRERHAAVFPFRRWSS